MPYWFENKVRLRVPRHLDRRVKLTDNQRSLIKHLFSTGASQRGLARQFRVSRRLICFIVFPERKRENVLRHRELAQDGRYYDKYKHAQSVRLHRRHLRSIYGLSGRYSK